jgi:hypothetical protein
VRGARWPTQDKAATPIRQTRKFTARKKGRWNGRKKDQKLLRKNYWTEPKQKSRLTLDRETKTLTRATSLHSVALRAASVD